MSFEYTIWSHLATLFFNIVSLAVTGLSCVEVRFLTILRDRINTVDDIWGNSFQSLPSEILMSTVLAAVTAGAFTVYGAVITAHPRWLRKYESIPFLFVALQINLASIMIVTGVYSAYQVRGFRPWFENLSGSDDIPYYTIMYYGGVSQAAYGSVLVFLTITVVVAYAFFGCRTTRRRRSAAG